MSDLEWKTKKEKILENARKDPFLKIEDLAKLANTTPRYVRTILSEANLSLMQLRREYARKMENRDGNLCDHLLFNYLISVPFASENQVLAKEEMIFNSPDDFNALSGDINRDYVCQSYLHLIKGTPWCISTALVKKKEIDLGDNRLIASELFSRLCKTIKDLEIKVSSIDLEIKQATNQIASLLKISPLAPIFRVRQSIESNSQTIALMLLYFNYKQVTLSFSHNKGLIINRKSVND